MDYFHLSLIAPVNQIPVIIFFSFVSASTLPIDISYRASYTLLWSPEAAKKYIFFFSGSFVIFLFFSVSLRRGARNLEANAIAARDLRPSRNERFPLIANDLSTVLSATQFLSVVTVFTLSNFSCLFNTTAQLLFAPLILTFLSSKPPLDPFDVSTIMDDKKNVTSPDANSSSKDITFPKII